VDVGGCCPYVYFLCSPVLNSAASVVQTAGGVGVYVFGPSRGLCTDYYIAHPSRVWRNTMEIIL